MFLFIPTSGKRYNWNSVLKMYNIINTWSNWVPYKIWVIIKFRLIRKYEYEVRGRFHFSSENR